jgi:NAD(P)-dependent dehydrogenase (short-subunit alcohol dehydrogenase family)
VVTGAGRGIGRGEALLLASEGASVVVNDLGAQGDGTGSDARPAQQVVDEVVAAGGRATASYENVADFDGAGRLVHQAVPEYGRLDILVNNAGILHDRMIFNQSPEDFDAVVAVHLRGHFATMRHACAYWRDEAKRDDAKPGGSAGGRVVNTSSMSGLLGMTGQSAYGAAKAGIAAMTQIASLEMRRYGVTVNAICPTARTRLTEEGGRMERHDGANFDLMDPANVAPLVAYLASDAAADITGYIFGVFGDVVHLYEPWSLGPVVERPEPGPWSVSELAAHVPALFRDRPVAWNSEPRQQLIELLAASRARAGEGAASNQR